MKDKTVDSYFNKAFSKYIVKEFSQYGFKKYRSRFVARIIHDSIFQLITFQKDAYGRNQFTVNVSLRPLYIPHEFLILEPGERLTKFTNQTNKWWSFQTEIESEDSFNQVSQVLKDKVICMFDTLSTTNALINYYNTETFPITWYSSLANGLYDLAYMFLKEHRFEEAIENFIKACDLYKSFGFDWSEEKYKECKDVLRLCEEENDKIDGYLEKCEQQSLEVLKLDKNKYFCSKE